MKERKFKYVVKVLTDYILVFLIILSCGSIYDNLTNVNLYISEVTMILLAAKIVIKTVNIKKRNTKNIKKIIYFSIIYSIYQAIYIFFHIYNHNVGFNILIYVFKLVVIFLMFICYYSLQNDEGEFNDILNYISNIICCISLISLIFYFGGSVLHILKATNTVNITFGFTRDIKSYFMIYFEPQYTIVLNRYVIRNCGVFAEAPMFTIPLLISFSYEILFKEKIEIYKLIILLVTILTTMSTIGIVISLALVIVYILKKLLKKKNINKSKIIKIIILAVCIGSFFSGIVVIDKLRSPSFAIRIDDYVASIKAWWKSPCFGNRLSKL